MTCMKYLLIDAAAWGICNLLYA